MVHLSGNFSLYNFGWNWTILHFGSAWFGSVFCDAKTWQYAWWNWKINLLWNLKWPLCSYPFYFSHPTGFGTIERWRSAMSEVPAPQLLRQSHSWMPAEDGGRSSAVPARGVPEHYSAGEERRSACYCPLCPSACICCALRILLYIQSHSTHIIPLNWNQIVCLSCCFVQTWPTCTPCCGLCPTGCLIWSRSCRFISTMRASEAPVTSLRKTLVLQQCVSACMSLLVVCYQNHVFSWYLLGLKMSIIHISFHLT